MRCVTILALAAACAVPALAQSSDGPLGEILEALPDSPPAAPPRAEAEEPFIPRIAPPPPQSMPVVTSRSPSGIITTTLPPSSVENGPFAPPPVDAPMLEVEAVMPEDSDVAAVPAPLTPEQLEAIEAAQWQVSERTRLAELDRRRAERAEAVREAHDARLAEHEAALATHGEEIAGRDAAYAEALEEHRLRAERERAEWEARVRACRSGRLSACAARGQR